MSLPATEFSRPVPLDRIGGAPVTERIEADEAERAALAERFGLIAIDRLEAEAALSRDGEIVRATGRVWGEAVQRCVASAAPVPATVDAPFELRFIPPPRTGEEEEIELDSDDCDTVFYQGRAIDIGEAAAESFALALDPFPRAPDAEAALRAAGVIGEEEAGPFGALKALRDKMGGGAG